MTLSATADTPWGDLQVFVTHLTNGAEEVNRGQAASLLDFVNEHGKGPAIVAGDFNAPENSTQIVALSRAWLDLYRIANPDDEGLTCCADDLTEPSDERLEKRIDYVFLVPAGDRGYEVQGARRVLDRPYRSGDGWQWASDHVGLLVVLALKD